MSHSKVFHSRMSHSGGSHSGGVVLGRVVEIEWRVGGERGLVRVEG